MNKISRILLIIHHIALCTPCIVIFNYGHLLHVRVDDAEPKSEIQAEQVQKEYDGPQAPSSMDSNLDEIKARPGAFNHAPCLLI
jgi:hypothetical protein